MITRRLAVAAILGMLAIAGIAGCRSAPSVAAYVGDRSYTITEVDQIHDEIQAKYQADLKAAGLPPQTNELVSRQKVVSILVARDVAKALAESKKLTKSNITAQQVAQVEGVPADTRYAQTLAEYHGYLDALDKAATATNPSDADLQFVVDQLVQAQALEPMSLEQARAALGEGNLGVLARAGQVRDEMQAQARTANVVVNPRYAPAQEAVLELPANQGPSVPLVVVRFDQSTGTPAVVDRTNPDAAPAQSAA